MVIRLGYGNLKILLLFIVGLVIFEFKIKFITPLGILLLIYYF